MLMLMPCFLLLPKITVQLVLNSGCCISEDYGDGVTVEMAHSLSIFTVVVEGPGE